MESERRSVLDHVQEFGETQQTPEKLEEWWKELTELQESEERVRIEQDKVQDEFSRCIFGTKGSGGGGD
jgi:DNA-directed RNA polymerase subunit F